MNPHFFTAPFYFAFIWFRVQGSRGGFAPFLEDGILVAAFPSRAMLLSEGNRWLRNVLLPPSGGSAEGNRGMLAV